MKKIYVITGASSGIGYQLAKRLSKDNLVIILARKASKTDIVNNSNVIGINTDVKSNKEISIAFKKIVKEYNVKTIHGLINCAGVAYEQSLLNISEKNYLDIFDTNVKGLIFVTKTFVPLLKRNEAIICNISSIAGIKGFANWSLYAASKYAVEGFTQSIRYELQKKGIRVMTVRPGSVDTNIYKHLSSDEKKDFIRPETIAEAIYSLLQLPSEAVAEDIFINNSIGDL